MLFNDTILENVLNGLRDAKKLDPEMKRQLVVDACIQANAHDFIKELPHGYDTKVGERADMLSGGQKQRIAIARAIISNPKIILLDEATSALDLESERAVQAAIDRAAAGRTTIIIAHRLSTIEHANKIIVLKDGRVHEQGTHSELLARQDLYHRLLSAQAAATQERRAGPDTSQIRATADIDKLHVKIKKSHLDETALTSGNISRHRSLMACLWRIIWAEPATLPFFIVGSLGSLMGAAVFPIQAYLFSKLVTVFQLHGQNLINRGNFWALMYFILGLNDILSFFLIFFFFGVCTMRITRALRPLCLQGILSQDISFFEIEGHSSGALTSLLLSDADELELMIGQNIGLIFMFVGDMIASCVLALAIYWKLALVAIFGCMPALLLAGVLHLRFDRYAQDRCATYFLESARFTAEAVAAIRTVSAFGLECRIVERYSNRLDMAVTASAKASFWSMLFFSLSDSLDFLGLWRRSGSSYRR